jgi:hypothetical protein
MHELLVLYNFLLMVLMMMEEFYKIIYLILLNLLLNLILEHLMIEYYQYLFIYIYKRSFLIKINKIKLTSSLSNPFASILITMSIHMRMLFQMKNNILYTERMSHRFRAYFFTFL